MENNNNSNEEHLSLIDINMVYKSFVSLKNEINDKCRKGEYDLDSVQTLLYDLEVVKKSIETLDKCQNALIKIAKPLNNN